MAENSPLPPSAPQEPHRRELLQRTVHDLKNPLAVVHATLEWLEVELRERDDVLDALRDASTATGRMMSIVEDLDTLGHLEAGRVIGRRQLDLGAVVGAVRTSAEARLSGRNVSVTSNVRGTIETLGDDALLRRALEALVDHCARGASAGSCVEIEAGIERGGEGGGIVVAVGLRGAAPSAPATLSLDGFASGGLGVYLAMRVLEKHGGTLEIVPTETVPRLLARLPT